MSFKEELIQELRANSNREMAIPMENYLKNNFSCLGIKTEKRRAIFKSVYEKHKAEIKRETKLCKDSSEYFVQFLAKK